MNVTKKSILVFAVVILGAITVFSQTTVELFGMGTVEVNKTNITSSELVGKWETSYDMEGEKVFVVYEIKKEMGKYKAYSVLLKNEKGEAQPDNTLVMPNIQLGKKSDYVIEYEGKKYDIKADVKLKSMNTIEVFYNYYGYKNTEIWKKVK
ncbi:hypothetical protein WH52_11000 [Tenacibaculum holothuriorum]|uniref:DUF4488 domain-containing protein n=1 Tax=Tenacibaculum holothuriorum TaxID=1635173 RepID=A0A1Y2PBM9_9FLAO|nr:hypothetical protein [Tenacibaculum holothuriorum]OSY87401.1 hypothetical protein WH52_11000 [Tenacibaculum holothuriorum]